MRGAVVRFLRDRPRWARRILSMAGEAQPAHPVVLDYALDEKRRWDEGRPHPQLQALLAAGDHRYSELLAAVMERRDALAAINRDLDATMAPAWNNGWQPVLDAAVLYTLVARHRPATYLEVGSGHSTRFARRAIDDHHLATHVISIDPRPVEVDALVDERIQQPVEACDLALFDRLGAGDILFIDGSHRCFMNTDVTTLFLDVLPRLPAGVLVHIHDIFLPYDYPAEFHRWYFNEQYLLACYLLGGATPFEVVLPTYYACHQPRLMAPLAPLWQESCWNGLPVEGWGFWVRTRGR
jgi:hypothetical protein